MELVRRAWYGKNPPNCVADQLVFAESSAAHIKYIFASPVVVFTRNNIKEKSFLAKYTCQL